ncbi:MAG: hypothetical protein M1469_00880 [Bacteroidetes bacterium]|nr:hypothetical protein [Bacteroidota bacterium]
MAQAGPFNYYLSYTANTENQLNVLAGLKPKTLAIMHGSSLNGGCEKTPGEVAPVIS